MSSIYPKGRDGYYYYQAYVYNPDTGKMNKRIFHSLGTKDQAEAEKLQFELDLQHEHQKTQSQKENSLSSRFSNWKTLAFVLAIVIVIIFNIDIFQSDSVKLVKRETIVKKPVLEKDEIPKTTEKKHMTLAIKSIKKIFGKTGLPRKRIGNRKLIPTRPSLKGIDQLRKVSNIKKQN